MKKFLLGFVLLIVSFIFTCNVFCEEMRSVIFTQKINSVKQGNLFESKTWMKDTNVRMEYIAGGEVTISVIKEGRVYNFNPVRKIGMVMNITAVSQEQMGTEIIQSKIKLENFLSKMNAEKSGEETIDDKVCDIYSYIEPRTKIENKLWIWRDEFFPVKSTIEAKGDVITVLYEEIQLDADISTSSFEVPDDIKFEEVQPPVLPEV